MKSRLTRDIKRMGVLTQTEPPEMVAGKAYIWNAYEALVDAKQRKVRLRKSGDSRPMTILLWVYQRHYTSLDRATVLTV